MGRVEGEGVSYQGVESISFSLVNHCNNKMTLGSYLEMELTKTLC